MLKAPWEADSCDCAAYKACKLLGCSDSLHAFSDLRPGPLMGACFGNSRAQVLGAEPELFFLSSALQLSGFQAELPNPALPLTIFAPNNAAFLGLLSELSAYCWPHQRNVDRTQHMYAAAVIYVCYLHAQALPFAGEDVA